MTLLVRNEEEVLAANLDFHLAQGVDIVIVTDNGSTDATRAILAPYQARGVVQVIDDPTEAHSQARQVTRMGRLAATDHGADWVINNDADEFWWPQVGTLRDVFAPIPDRYGQLLVRRTNFVAPFPGDAPFYRRMVVREAHSLSPRGGTLEPKVAHRGLPDVRVATGNHTLRHPPLLTVPVPDLVEVFHFPMRSPEQFAQNVEQTGRAYARLATRHHEDDGRDQRMLYGLQRRGELQDWFEARAPSASDIEAGVRDGTLVLDRRLEHFIDSREAVPSSDRARAIVGAALALAEHAEDLESHIGELREHIGTLDAHLASTRAAEETLRGAVGELGAYVEELEERNAELLHRHDAVHASLEAVRNSALMRATRPVRRLYYRLR